MYQCPVGIKIPGIHWEISDPKMPRAAEISPRLIPERFLSRVVVHNKDHEGYSRAENLVNWMADDIHKLGVELMGENALAGELYGKQI